MCVCVCRLVILFVALFAMNLVLAVFHYRLQSFKQNELQKKKEHLTREVSRADDGLGEWMDRARE